MNSCNFIGRVGRDAQVRYTQGGKAVTGWALAVDTGFGDSKTTLWLDCSWWGDRATKVADYIKKGDRLGVVGEIGSREHEGKTHVTLNVRDVTLLGNKQEGGTSSSGSRGGAPQRTRPLPATAPAEDDFRADDIPFISGRGRF